MRTMLINAAQHDEVRVAITQDRILLDLDTEYPDQKRKKSDIYKGIITSIEPSLGAVFVNYGSERHGFLPIKEISREYFLHHNQDHLDVPDINSVLKTGQEVVVQIDKEERGNKGAALTTFISLAGAYLVLMPNNPRAGGISRRIDGDERDQLRESIAQLELPEGMGVIVRTAGVSKNKEELQWDLAILLRYWEAIKKAAIAKPGPYLIHQEGDVIIRAIRDYLRQDVNEVIIDDAEAYEKARQHLNQVRPDFIDRLKLYKDPTPLFSRYKIEQQIEAAYQREVRLPSGGSLVIDQTEALVSVDINSSRATKGKSIEETALNINLEAADEIARQLRIRDIGGLIVIDFIDMTPVRNQREVETRLRDALSMDRARIQVGRISRFGLLEMSRQRLRSALNKANQVPCPRCSGKGTIRSVESSALSIIHMVQEQVLHASEGSEFQVQLPIEVATYIMNEKRALIEEIEKNNPVKVTIIPNHNLLTPNYSLRLVTKEEAARDGYLADVPSYKLVQASKPENNLAKKSEPIRPMAEPAINQFLKNEADFATNPHRQGLISKLIKKLFGPAPIKAAPPRAPQAYRGRPQRNHSTQGSSGPRPPRERGPRAPRTGERPAHERGERTERNTEEGARRPNGNRSRRGNRGGQRRQPYEQRAEQKPQTDVAVQSDIQRTSPEARPQEAIHHPVVTPVIAQPTQAVKPVEPVVLVQTPPAAPVTAPITTPVTETPKKRPQRVEAPAQDTAQ